MRVLSKSVAAVAFVGYASLIPTVSGVAASYCAIENKYYKKAINEYKYAKTLLPAQSRLVLRNADAFFDDAEVNPDTGKLWDYNEYSITNCDVETNEAYDAAFLLWDENQVNNGLDDDSRLLSNAFDFNFPNRFLSTDEFRILVMNAVADLRRHHELLDHHYTDHEALVTAFKEFFEKWLGTVPEDIFP